MIGKVIRRSGVGARLSYSYSEGRGHSDPHIIGAWADRDPASLEPDRRNGKVDLRGLTQLLEAPLTYARSAPAKDVWEVSLRAADGDRRLTDDEWADVARDVMDRTGLAKRGDTGGCRWVAVRHADDHIHVVATLARTDGKPARVWQDHPAVMAACRAAEERYDLRRVETPNEKPTRPLERQRAAIHRHAEPDRERLRREVRVAAVAATNAEDFLSRLKDAGVAVKPRYSQQDPSKLTGYAVAIPQPDHRATDGRAVYFSGGKLAADLTLPQLEKRWAQDRHTAPNGERLVSVQAESPTRRAARAVRQAVGRPITPETAAGARDVLLAAARSTEGRTRGPLTRTADRFARTTSGPGHAALALAAARMLQQPQRDNQATVELIAALAALAVAVNEMHAQQQRAQQAQVAKASAAELRAWRPPAASRTANPAATSERRPSPPSQQAKGPIRRR